MCNHIKSTKKDKIKNPFSEDYDNGLMFTASCFMQEGCSTSFISEDENTYEVSLFRDNMSQLDNNEADMLGIEERYSGCDKYVKEIIVKHYAYKDEYFEELAEMCGTSGVQLKGYVFGYSDDHNNRPLSKFNKDILEQCDLLNENMIVL